MTPAELEERLTHFVRVCRDSGLKVTPQRIATYREVARTEEHPDAQTVFDRVREHMPTVSLDTVYRTLCTLEQKGLISRVETASGPARFDANTERHHHFLCRVCGLLRDFYSEDLDRIAPPRGVTSWGHVDSVHVQLRGTCARCVAGRAELSTSGATGGG